jgi:hypothetical protein
VCYVQRTADDAIIGNEPCGGPFKQCLTEECGNEWSGDCLAILAGSGPLRGNADAWMDCLMTSNLSHSLNGASGGAGIAGAGQIQRRARASRKANLRSPRASRSPVLDLKLKQ